MNWVLTYMTDTTMAKIEERYPIMERNAQKWGIRFLPAEEEYE